MTAPSLVVVERHSPPALLFVLDPNPPNPVVCWFCWVLLLLLLVEPKPPKPPKDMSKVCNQLKAGWEYGMSLGGGRLGG